MVTASFLFHAPLDIFLLPSRRGRWFDHRFDATATLKHAIEALGIPHTEIGHVLVDGKEAGCGDRLPDGAQVEVRPPPGLVGPMPGKTGNAEPPRFAADAHLGGLAHLLRMAGFDTLYDNNFLDDEIERLAWEEGRIVLSRDRELLKRRGVLQGCFVYRLKPEQQLFEIVDRLGLRDMARPLTLCLECNVPLRPADKNEVLDRLPPRVRAGHDRFSTCDTCRRVFWEGSHWNSMRALMARLTSPVRREGHRHDA